MTKPIKKYLKRKCYECERFIPVRAEWKKDTLILWGYCKVCQEYWYY